MNDYRKKLYKKIKGLKTQVFSRSDLSENQTNKEQLRLNRALKSFIDQGLILKISHGLYAKAKNIVLPDGTSKVILRKPFEKVAIEALKKLNLNWELGKEIQEYNKGESTQIPIKFTIRLHSRFRGDISAGNRKVFFEGNRNAR